MPLLVFYDLRHTYHRPGNRLILGYAKVTITLAHRGMADTHNASPVFTPQNRKMHVSPKSNGLTLVGLKSLLQYLCYISTPGESEAYQVE